MLMETFDRVSNKEKYSWDMTGHVSAGIIVASAFNDQK